MLAQWLHLFVRKGSLLKHILFIVHEETAPNLGIISIQLTTFTPEKVNALRQNDHNRRLQITHIKECTR